MDLFRAFGPPTKFAQEFLLFTDGLGHLNSKDFMIHRESFNNNLVMVVLSGTLHVEQNGHFILKQNEGIMMKLTDPHKYYTDDIDTCEILWMHFNGRQAAIYLNYLEQNITLPIIFNERQVGGLIKQCFTLYNDKSSEREFLLSQRIYSILLTILHWVSVEKASINISPQTEFMNNTINYIDNNIYSKITLDEIARHMNVSAYHYCRVFKKHFHITPMQYVLMKKIELSKYMLAYTHDAISTIASTLAFVDQSHFSKTFKHFEKQTPLAFRKKSTV